MTIPADICRCQGIVGEPTDTCPDRDSCLRYLERDAVLRGAPWAYLLRDDDPSHPCEARIPAQDQDA